MSRDFEAESNRITPVYRPKQVGKTAPCQVGCANCGDIRGWIGTVAQRAKTGMSREVAFKKAWQIITDVNEVYLLYQLILNDLEMHENLLKGADIINQLLSDYLTSKEM